MAVSAYILIQTEVGKAAQVAQEVDAIDGVVSSEDVTGPYDVIARAEASTVDELGKMVVSRVQMIDGITRTLTCPVVHLSSGSLATQAALDAPPLALRRLHRPAPWPRRPPWPLLYRRVSRASW